MSLNDDNLLGCVINKDQINPLIVSTVCGRGFQSFVLVQ
jgi:hypothetical protein